MAYSETLANQIRQARAHPSDVEEKKMFGSLAFMVNGRMCLRAGAGRMMCRIDPNVHKEAIQRKGCHTVVLKGRDYKGYVYVGEDGFRSRGDFDYWVALALDFNGKQGK